jgi:hypothetical protein
MVFFLCAVFPAVTFAQAKKVSAAPTGRRTTADAMARRTQGMVVGMIMNGKMVASGDGGVIVMMGDKLIKYDKNLKFVKETEIAVDLKGTAQKMIGQ